MYESVARVQLGVLRRRSSVGNADLEFPDLDNARKIEKGHRVSAIGFALLLGGKDYPHFIVGNRCTLAEIFGVGVCACYCIESNPGK